MRIPRVYLDQPLAVTESLALTEQAAHYLGRVLRLKVGRELRLFNGKGGEYLARISQTQGKKVSVAVEQFIDLNNESSLNIHVAIGISQGDRFDMVVQKATELGVTSIQPLFTERVEGKMSSERLQKKQRHWQGVCQAACEQSHRTILPVIHSSVSLSDYLANKAHNGFMLHPLATQSLMSAILEPVDSAQRQQVNVLVGPEGGFSEEEVASAKKANFNLISLGPRILRTETVPMAAISILQARWGDL